jgi:hypothetical protein
MSDNNPFHTWPPLSNADLLRRVRSAAENDADSARKGQPSDEVPKVGYKRPPSHSQFQPGVSGNPRGRRKRYLNVKEEIQQVYLRKMTVQDGLRKQNISKIVLLFNRLLNDGLKGDRRAALAAAKMATQFGVYEMSEKKFVPDFSTLTNEEREICIRAGLIIRRIR